MSSGSAIPWYSERKLEFLRKKEEASKNLARTPKRIWAACLRIPTEILPTPVLVLCPMMMGMMMIVHLIGCCVSDGLYTLSLSNLKGMSFSSNFTDEKQEVRKVT